MGYNFTMTCIVAIAHEGNVYMGGERAASDGKYIEEMEEPKICTRNGYLFGYAGNIGVGQYVINNFKFPDTSTPQEMHTIFLPALKALFHKADMLFKEEDEVEFLIAKNGRVYGYHGSDHQLVSYRETSIGSGGGVAIGSLYTTRSWKSQEKRIHTAISAAIEYTVSCTGTIDILSA